MGKYEDALKDADKCIQLSKEFIKGYIRKIICEIALKKYINAFSTITSAIELAPSNFKK